jgi:hypothetical protein
MKDSVDVMNYVGQHTVLRERLHNSGAPLRDGDAIYSLLIRLPHTPIWQLNHPLSLSIVASCTSWLKLLDMFKHMPFIQLNPALSMRMQPPRPPTPI